MYAFFRRWRESALVKEFRDRQRDRLRTPPGLGTEPTAVVRGEVLERDGVSHGVERPEVVFWDSQFARSSAG
ncbi:hypothetical protein AB0O64_35670 [Streptomyces sp. NPDC088341]|uniref:hypothetical protein n=1 Tax=Streptomyces sp. NPDC088341 TaxID=3154870 RepID=UPI0034125C4B